MDKLTGLMTIGFILTFIGMVIVTVFVTEVSKLFTDKRENPIPSRKVSLAVATLLVVIAGLISKMYIGGLESILGMIVWMIANTCFVWYVANGLYDDILKKVMDIVKAKILGVDLNE